MATMKMGPMGSSQFGGSGGGGGGGGHLGQMSQGQGSFHSGSGAWAQHHRLDTRSPTPCTLHSTPETQETVHPKHEV